MPGIEYTRSDDALVGSLRHVFGFGDRSGHIVEVGRIDIAASAGPQSFTGVGFQPELLGIMGSDQAIDDDVYGACMHVGWSDGTNQFGLSSRGQYNNFTWSAARSNYHRNDRIVEMEGGSNYGSYLASLQSFDSDGFTLNITTAPLTAKRWYYIAVRGNPDGYAVGTLTAGTTAVTGLGFRPGGLLTFNGGAGPLATANVDGEYMAIGAADATEQYSMWTGCRYGAPFLSNRVHNGKIATFAIGANASGGVGCDLEAQAQLDSFDSDGFTLSWPTNIGGTRYMSWVAIGGRNEVEQFTYPAAAGNHILNFDEHGPVGIIGFGNEQTAEGVGQQFYGCGCGLSWMGDDVTEEIMCSWGEFYPVTLSITTNRREGGRNNSCGAFAATHSGADNWPRNNINIIRLIPSERMPQFIRRPLG